MTAAEQSLHTPGPWKIDYADTITVREEAKNGRICSLYMLMPGNYGRRSPREVEANARLIAAAPDLLDACKEFVRKVESGEARSTRSYQQMKAAIAKAEGRALPSEQQSKTGVV